METKLLQLALNNLVDAVEQLKADNRDLKREIEKLKSGSGVTHQTVTRDEQDKLLTILDARSILDVSKSVFLKMVEKGVFTPIRLNLRTIRYSRKEIQDWIQHSH